MLFHEYHYISVPKNDGLNKASGHLNLSFPIVMTCPPGNSYDLSNSDDETVFCISSEKFFAT